MQESLQLKNQLLQESDQTRERYKTLREAKKKVENKTSMEKMEMPLKFLNQNAHLEHLGQDFLRHLTLNLTECLVMKEKLVKNIESQNVSLAQRLATLSDDDKDPKVFYDPEKESAEPAKTKVTTKYPIV